MLREARRAVLERQVLCEEQCCEEVSRGRVAIRVAQRAQILDHRADGLSLDKVACNDAAGHETLQRGAGSWVRDSRSWVPGT